MEWTPLPIKPYVKRRHSVPPPARRVHVDPPWLWLLPTVPESSQSGIQADSTSDTFVPTPASTSSSTRSDATSAPSSSASS